MDLTTQTASGQDDKPDNAGPALPSLDDAITAALGGEAEKPAAEPQTAAEPKSPDQAKAKPDTSTGDTHGQEDAKPQPRPADDKDQTKADAPEASKPLDAPQHWPAERKQAFQGLPDDAKRAMLAMARDLEGGFTRKSQEVGDKVKYADAVRGLFSPEMRQQLAHVGTDEVGFIQYLTRLQQMSARDPVGYIRYAMDSLRVSPEHLFPQSPKTQQPATQQAKSADEAELDDLLKDPAVKAMEAKLAHLEGWKNEQESREADAARRRDEAARNQYAQHVQSIQNAVSQFRQSLDDNGQLKFPHFDVVSRQMGALMDTDPEIAAMPDGPAKLEAAYDRAVWAIPSLRAQRLDAERATAAADAQKRADAARAKAVTAVKPSSGVPATRSRVSTLDDAITQAFSQAGL